MRPAQRKTSTSLIPPPPSVDEGPSESATWPKMDGLPEAQKSRTSRRTATPHGTLKMPAVASTPPASSVPTAEPKAAAAPRPPTPAASTSAAAIPTEISRATALFDDMLADVSAPLPVGVAAGRATPQSPSTEAERSTPQQPELQAGAPEPVTDPEETTEAADATAVASAARQGLAAARVVRLRAGAVPRTVAPEGDAESWFASDSVTSPQPLAVSRKADPKWAFGMGGLAIGLAFGFMIARVTGGAEPDVRATADRPAPSGPSAAPAAVGAAPKPAPAGEDPAPTDVAGEPPRPGDTKPEPPPDRAEQSSPSPVAATEGTGQRPPASADGTRIAPAETTEDTAAIYAKIPIKPEDLAPVGGVGANGTHVDRIVVGEDDGKGACAGSRTVFSIENDDRVYACFRIVRPRAGDKLTIRWRKDGDSKRRSFFPMDASVHATRQRAFIGLRAGWEGEWSIHVIASDGTELASAPFTVTP